jgi:hypothetical protein
MTVQTTHLSPPMAGHADVYAAGKLNPATHFRLVEDLERIAREAGVSPRDITGQDYSLTDVEKKYLIGFKRTHLTGKLGIIYVGQHDPSVLNRSRSIVGALLRNFITARLAPREVLINSLFHNAGKVKADLVAVPDFHYADAPAATRRALSSWIMDRVARGQQTVLGVPNPKVLNELFGDAATGYMQHFEVATGFVHNPA